MNDIDSILTSVKKYLGGITEDDEAFDSDIIMFINSAFSTLHQLGVGPQSGFRIRDKNDKWSDYISDDRLSFIKEYVFIKVKLSFDPPQNSSVLSAFKENLKELEWRINVTAETECI